MNNEGYQKTQQQVTSGGALKRYQHAIVGSESLWYTLYYEFCCWLGPIPGAAGLLLRSLFWPGLFKRCGKGVQFGRSIVLRHPGRIVLGDNVVTGEGCVLDARNQDVETALVLQSDCMLSNYVIINCKGGTVDIGKRAGIGAQTIIQSVNLSPVKIGDDVIIGPRCYIVGGASYHYDQLDIPINQQGIKTDPGCDIGNNVWIGANSTMLGGAKIGDGAIIAAHALVKNVVAENTIVGGVPASRISDRSPPVISE